VTVSFAVQKLLSLMQSRLFIVFLDAESFEFYLGSHSLYLSVHSVVQLFPGVVSKFQAFAGTGGSRP
jgi:hypothetical protein